MDEVHAKSSRPVRLRLGHPSRLTNGTLSMTMIFIGYFAVFMASLFHDELALELANMGWISVSWVEMVELFIGLALFLCWGALTAVQIRFLDHVRAQPRRQRDDRS